MLHGDTTLHLPQQACSFNEVLTLHVYVLRCRWIRGGRVKSCSGQSPSTIVPWFGQGKALRDTAAWLLDKTSLWTPMPIMCIFARKHW